MQTKKINTFIISLVFCLTSSVAQIKTVVNFNTQLKTKDLREIKLRLVGQTDTVTLNNHIDTSGFAQKQIIVEIPKDSFLAIFEYTEEQIQKKIEYNFDTKDLKLKRIEIDLSFGYYEEKISFLEDFTIDKFFYTDNVLIYPAFKTVLGAQPAFVLINKSNTTYFGCSSTGHFYGSLNYKLESGWTEYYGNYCGSTVHAKPFGRADTVVSFIPNYFSGDEYKISKYGTYKYFVTLGLEEYSSGIPNAYFKKFKTRKRIREFYELEYEFAIEQK